MPAPTNTSALTATDLGTLPASVTQTVDFGGTTYTVWYKYTATDTDAVIGLFGYGDATYAVRTRVYNDPSGSFSARIIDTGVGADANRAVQFAVSAGTTYYVSFAPPAGNPSPAVLTLEAESFAQQTAAAGFLAVPDDTPGFPLTLINTGTEAVERFVSPFPAGEAGDVLDNGIMLVTDLDAVGLALYDTQFNVITTISSVDPKTNGGAIRTCQGTQRFWVLYGSGTTRFVRSVDDDGTLGTPHTLTAITDVACIAVQNDESVLYHCASSSSAIHRWDLVNDVALSDLVANTANYQTFDLLVLGDDSIVASAIKTSATVDVQAKRYDSSGTLLNTYNFGSAQSFPAGTLPRLAYASADPTSFWIWTHPSGADAGKSLFQEVTVATGAIATSVQLREYETGVYEGTATATPDARFGNSFSCPFWVLRAEFPTGGGGSTGTIRVVKATVPSNLGGTFVFAAGGGLTPDTFTLTAHGDEQVFNTVTAGSGYSISETSHDGFALQSIEVSNGSDPTNISVSADEVVVVTVTNTVAPVAPETETFPIRWLRRSPTVNHDGKRLFHRRFQVDFQPGVGLAVADGAHDRDPIVLVRTSDDGGFTWSSFRQMTLGERGNYLKQMRLYQLGATYARVYEISGDSPVPLCIVQAWLDLDGSDH